MQKSIRQMSRTAILTLSFLGVTCSAIADETPPQPTTAATQAQQPANTPTSAIPQEKPATTAIRVGYVDIAKVAEESKAGKSGLAQFRDKADKYEAKAKTKEKQLDKLKAALETQLPTLPPDKRAAKIKEFDKKVEEFRHFAQNVEKEMRAMQEELNKNIFNSMEKAARAYGTANGYAAIVTKKELLYLGPSVDAHDLTEAILKQVNEQQ